MRLLTSLAIDVVERGSGKRKREKRSLIKSALKQDSLLRISYRPFKAVPGFADLEARKYSRLSFVKEQAKEADIACHSDDHGFNNYVTI